jgi:hypothetical protein
VRARGSVILDRITGAEVKNMLLGLLEDLLGYGHWHYWHHCWW